jgi:single-strand selective monofunctional uracil DNA glycosylase
MDPVRITRALTRAVDKLEFEPPVTHVYNPLRYAKRSQEVYLERFARRGIEALFLGMNPGPFGMAQTGVPFGEVNLVRDWIGIEEPVGKPRNEHPKRPITGFACTRSEVSGRRMWGWAQERFESAEAFFQRFFVWNYCPLVFLEETGRNRTPDKLPVAEREPLFAACNTALVRMVEYCQPRLVIGVGKFAETRAREVLGHLDVEFGTILHPSPASPMANRGWAPQAERQLAALGIEL